MKLGNFKIFICFCVSFFLFTIPVFGDNKIQSVPLINLEDLSPTFEEDKDELEKVDDKSIDLDSNENILDETNDENDDKVFVNLKALDKITAKTSLIKLAVGEMKSFGPLEIKALKCELSEKNDIPDTVAYIQVKDLSAKDNNQVFLFNGWTFASNPTLQSIDHPIYDLWITGCENI